MLKTTSEAAELQLFKVPDVLISFGIHWSYKTEAPCLYR